MKIIKYHLKSVINDGTETVPILTEKEGYECTMPYSESNMEIAQSEAYGKITVEDDGQPEPSPVVSIEDRVLTLEQQLANMESAYAEGVQEA